MVIRDSDTHTQTETEAETEDILEPLDLLLVLRDQLLALGLVFLREFRPDAVDHVVAVLLLHALVPGDKTRNTLPPPQPPPPTTTITTSFMYVGIQMQAQMTLNGAVTAGGHFGSEHKPGGGKRMRIRTEMAARSDRVYITTFNIKYISMRRT